MTTFTKEQLIARAIAKAIRMALAVRGETN